MEQQRDDLAGDLGTVTDEEWRAAHERLGRDLFEQFDQPGSDAADEVGRQMAYVWSPGMPAREGGYEPDVAPLAGQWDGRLRGGE